MDPMIPYSLRVGESVFQFLFTFSIIHSPTVIFGIVEEYGCEVAGEIVYVQLKRWQVFTAIVVIVFCKFPPCLRRVECLLILPLSLAFGVSREKRPDRLLPIENLKHKEKIV